MHNFAQAECTKINYSSQIENFYTFSLRRYTQKLFIHRELIIFASFSSGGMHKNQLYIVNGNFLQTSPQAECI